MYLLSEEITMRLYRTILTLSPSFIVMFCIIFVYVYFLPKQTVPHNAFTNNRQPFLNSFNTTQKPKIDSKRFTTFGATTSLQNWKLNHFKDKNTSMEFKNFQPMMDTDQYLLMLEVWDKFTEICITYNITYILYGGTLLGSYRHHGFIPWDDDCDVIMRKTDVIKLRNITLDVDGYATYLRNTLKFYKLQQKYTSHNYGWTWPFIDVFPYEENETHIWDTAWGYDVVSWEKEKYFPLKYRPLEGKFHPVPLNVPYALHKEGKRNLSICQSNYWNHKLESYTNASESISCSGLFSMYPFVKRSYTENKVIEILKVNTTVLSEYEFHI